MRRRALGGIVGPVGFVIAWAVNGARTTGYSVLAATISGACLAGTVAGPAPGLLQRAGLLAGDVWIVATALAILTNQWTRHEASVSSEFRCSQTPRRR